MERKEGSQPKKSLLPSETDREINLAGIEGVLEGNNDIEELEAGGCKAFVDAFDSSCSESENFEDECSSICAEELEAPLGLDCLFVEEMEYAGTRKEQHLEEDNRELTLRHYLEDSLGQGDLSKVILKESSSQEDMLKSLFQVNYLYWLERNAGIKSRSACDDCRLGGRLRISLDYVEREFNHVKKDGELAGWITDGLIARPLPSRIRPGYVQFTPAT